MSYVTEVQKMLRQWDKSQVAEQLNNAMALVIRLFDIWLAVTV